MARLGSTLLLTAPLLLTALDANAQALRFTATAPGGIVATGNTLGLSKAPDVNGPGTSDAIGTFIALEPTSVDDTPVANPPWGAGTTSLWSENGSAAVLTIPAAAEVLYAELLWGGSSWYFTDVRGDMDDPVTLSIAGADLSVTPAPATALTIEEAVTGFTANYYMRSADVTAFISQHKSGTYTVSGVPATEDTAINTLNAAGWTLIVAYRDGSEPIRNLSVFVGGSFVDENETQDYTVDGFCAPPSGVVNGRVVVSAIEGDANLSDDTLGIAATDSGPFELLSGPNNPANNFFGSQINNKDGLLDTSGTFGNLNHDPSTATNVSGARQGWDITTVGVSSSNGQLANDQTSAVVRTTTTGDSYAPIAMALEIDVKSPDFGNSTTEASTTVTQIGDTFTVTATVTNTGEADATGMAFILDLDPGLTLDSYTTDGSPGDVNGTAVTGADLATGVDAGNLAISATRTVVLTLSVIDAPDDLMNFQIAPEWEHNFVTCDGDPAINESFTPPDVTIPFQGESSGAGGNASGAGGSGAGPTGAGGGGANDGDGDDIVEEGGCGCTTIGQEPAGTLSISAFLAASLFLARRRRRRR